MTELPCGFCGGMTVPLTPGRDEDIDRYCNHCRARTYDKAEAARRAVERFIADKGSQRD